MGFGAVSSGVVYFTGREEVGRSLRSVPDWRVDWDPSQAGVIARGGGSAANVRRALDALGGIERFISPGETVLIKPNVGWDRLPAQAADTDPEVIGQLVHLCRSAGARKIVVSDNPCNDPKRSFERSGIGPAARENGAEVIPAGGERFVPAALSGTLVGLHVMPELLEVDRVINVPVVKHHSLSKATLGMKNWFGVLGRGRPRLHQGIHRTVAELGATFRPTLTVVDATRVLVTNGPQGGRLEDVREVGAVAVGFDPVALDAWGASVLGLDPRLLGFIIEAERRGLGRGDPAVLRDLGAA